MRLIEYILVSFVIKNQTLAMLISVLYLYDTFTRYTYVVYPDLPTFARGIYII